MRKMTPMGALARGLLAGAVAAAAQSLFFKLTQKAAPAPPKEAFSPPEAQQKDEMPTVTVARRLVEGFMQRGPLEPEQKERAGQIVHFAFGALWGGVYGMLHESTRLLRGPLGGPLGALGFGSVVWAASDDVILPAFQLAAWPHKYPAKSHGYAIVAHLVYGAAVWGAFELTRTRALAPLAATLGAGWATRQLPPFVRPVARKALGAARRNAPVKRVRDVVDALSS